ncbi:MAG: TadE/TadG family type IV pilus assembly protein [Chloroflexota bacterium]
MSKLRRGRGQSLVEFALVLPIFMFAVLGLIDVTRLVYLNSTLSQAAREGARTGSVEASYRGSSDSGCGDLGGPICPANDAALVTEIRAAANRMMTPFGSVSSLYISCVEEDSTPPAGNWTSANTCPNNSPGSVLSVRVTAQFTPITPVLGQLLGTPLSGSATMTIN